MSLTLKFDVNDLIRNAEAQLATANAKADLTKATEKWEDDLAKWEAKAEKVLEHAPIKNARTDQHYVGGRYVTVLTVPAPKLPKRPQKPEAPRNSDVKQIEADLRLLRNTTQDTVSVSANSDLVRYV